MASDGTSYCFGAFILKREKKRVLEDPYSPAGTLGAHNEGDMVALKKKWEKKFSAHRPTRHAIEQIRATDATKSTQLHL